MPLTAAQITSRRRFIQFLAASPLFAGTSISALASAGDAELGAQDIQRSARLH